MCGSPGFLGNLETTVIWVRGAWPYSTESRESLQSSVRSTKPCRVPSVRLKSQKWHWRTNSWWRYSTFILARTFVWLLMDMASHCYEFLPFASMSRASQPLWKGWSGSHDSAQCSCSLLVYFYRIFLCYYPWVQLTCLDELYREYNGNAHTCASSGYQVLLSDILSTWEWAYIWTEGINCM